MDYIKITNSQFYNGLSTKRNMLVLGPSGWGKTATVEGYARDYELRIAYVDMAGQLPESIAGIPAVIRIKDKRVKDYSTDIAELKKRISKIENLILKTDDANIIEQLCGLLKTCTIKLDELIKEDGEEETYYRRMLDVELQEFLDCEGEGWILFFDEINQGNPESLNTLYAITHPNPEMRRWAGHRLSKCQIVACGNLADGRDGTVYLTELPTPLLNRFFVFELQPDKKDATEYLKKKWKNIPQVVKYIKAMLDANVAPRDVDLALDVLHYEHDGMFLEAKLGAALAAKIYDIQKGIRSLDPADMLKNARTIYNRFKENGEVVFGAETVTSEAELLSKFEEFLSAEEIAGITKGDE